VLGVEHSCAAVLPPSHAKIKIKKTVERVLYTRGKSANRGTEEQEIAGRIGSRAAGSMGDD